MRPTTPASTPFALAALAALGLAACGGGEEERSPRDRLAAAPQATADAGSSAFSLRMSWRMGDSDAGMEFTVSGDGAVDMERKTGRMEIQLPAAGLSSVVIVSGDTVYTRVPALLGGGGNQWVRRVAASSPAGADGGAGSDTAAGGEASGPEGTGDGDPAPGDGPASSTDELDRPELADRMAQVLDSIAGEITAMGADTVRGTEVQGYSFTMRGDRVWGGAGMPEGMQDVDVPVDAWLDAEDRLRRLVMKMDMGPLMQAAQERMPESRGRQRNPFRGMMAAMADTMTVTLEMYDFGTGVDATLPEGAEVRDAGEFEMQMPQGGARQQGTAPSSAS